MAIAQETFDYMAKVFKKEHALKLKKRLVLQYNVAGPGGGSWQLVMENGEYKIIPGNTIRSVSCTMNYDSADSLFKLATGAISGLKGYTAGKIKFTGNRAILEEMGKVFPGGKV